VWAQCWLKIKAGEVSAGRLVVYKSHVKHLQRYLTYAQLTKIRTADIQEVISELATNNPNTNKPMARATLNELKGTAAQICGLAVDNRMMDYNPAIAVKIPKQKVNNTKEERRALTDAEQAWITDTPHRAQRAAMIMVYAGLRRGEVIPLMWNDIDFEARTISVARTVEAAGNSFEIKSTAKTKSSIRTIDIPQRLVDFLQAQPRESIYVCIAASGKMHTPSSWSRTWKSYLADLNLKYGDFSPFGKQHKSKFDPSGTPFVIPNITPHWLRHTFATMLYMTGVDVLTAKEQLGHADIKTTLEIYSC